MTVLRMGFDAVQIDRMEKKLKGEAFCRRAFSEEENALFARKKHPAPTAAANFAAKEALAKALRCGIFGFDLREAPVLRREDGSPYFAFSGALARRMEQEGLAAELSLSHEGEYAFAVVLLQPAEKRSAGGEEQGTQEERECRG